MKILITGAHFTPAQAVVEELQKIGKSKKSENQKTLEIASSGQGGTRNDGGIDIVYVGRKYTLEGDKALSVESRIMPELGVKFIPITTGRLRRYLSLGTIISLFKLPIGFVQGFWIVLTQRPDIVVSFGGYVAVPIVISAWLLNIPVLIHEQTLVTGLANSISAHFATKIAVTIDQDYSFPKNKTVLTGNPIRHEILEVQKSNKHKLPTILITGGNQGSHFINDLISQNLAALTEKYYLIHQTGDSSYKDFEKLSEQKSQLKNPQNYEVSKFIDGKTMGQIMNTADLVISRAGANTLLELSFLGTPTLIIPIAYLYKNEQLVNAKFFTKAGLGEYLLQEGLSANKFREKINQMIAKNDYYKKQVLEAKKVVVLDAAKKLTQQILILAQND